MKISRLYHASFFGILIFVAAMLFPSSATAQSSLSCSTLGFSFFEPGAQKSGSTAGVFSSSDGTLLLQVSSSANGTWTPPGSSSAISLGQFTRIESAAPLGYSQFSISVKRSSDKEALSCEFLLYRFQPASDPSAGTTFIVAPLFANISNYASAIALGGKFVLKSVIVSISKNANGLAFVLSGSLSYVQTQLHRWCNLLPDQNQFPSKGMFRFELVARY